MSSLSTGSLCDHLDGGLPIDPPLPTNDLWNNSLSPTALRHTWPLLEQMIHHKLAPGLLSSPMVAIPNSSSALTWPALLATTDAAEVFKYVVSCALDPCDVIDVPAGPAFSSLRTRYPDGFHGGVGLCGGRYNQNVPGSERELPWLSVAQPSGACLERVSGCVLARVNAARRRVTISLRGDGLELQDKVPIDAEFREADGTPIVSFKRCDAQCLSGDPLRRNCDWVTRYVGQCTVGSTVTLNVVDSAPGAPTPHARIRICHGIHGCDDITPGAGAFTEPQPPNTATAYGGKVLAHGWDQVSFACPSNGPKLPNVGATGYYAVMLGAAATTPLPSSVDLAFPPATQTEPAPSLPNAYPAHEAAVFTYREAAFYGTIFEKPGPPPIVAPKKPCPVEGPFSNNQYVCVSNIWSDGAAAASDRFCAVPGSKCFANPVAACDIPKSGVTPSNMQSHVGKAKSPQVPDKEVYESCAYNNKTWQWPYTTYLNHPCDLFPDLDACVPYLEKSVKGTLFNVTTHNLSTGIDNTTQTPIAAGGDDDTWSVVSTPDGQNLGPPATAPFSAWSSVEPGSSYVSPLWVRMTNAPSAALASGSYVYETCFCLSSGFSGPRLALAMRADNRIRSVKLNTCTLPNASGGTFRDQEPLRLETLDPACFHPGQNCIRVDVYNDSGYSGFDVAGSVSATNGGTGCP